MPALRYVGDEIKLEKPVLITMLSGWIDASGAANNAIEALNAKLRSAVRARGHFPTDEAALKLLFLVLHRSEKEWTMPPREWSMAKAQFAVMFGERYARAMA